MAGQGFYETGNSFADKCEGDPQWLSISTAAISTVLPKIELHENTVACGNSITENE